LWFTSFGSVTETQVYVFCVVELNFVVENLVKKKKKKNYLFCFRMWDARWFVYPWIMDRNDNMGGGDSAYVNENYERQTKLSLVHNWTHKATSGTP